MNTRKHDAVNTPANFHLSRKQFHLHLSHSLASACYKPDSEQHNRYDFVLSEWELTFTPVAPAGFLFVTP